MNELYWYAGLGSVLLYGIGAGKGRDLVDKLLPHLYKHVPAGARDVISLAVYVAVGAFVGVLLADPANARAAFVAGFAWVGFLDAANKRVK